MTPKPSGTVAFLFTDIEGSTVLAQRHPDKLPALLTRHREILQSSSRHLTTKEVEELKEPVKCIGIKGF